LAKIEKWWLEIVQPGRGAAFASPPAGRSSQISASIWPPSKAKNTAR
jgi:hypothetical protein